MQVTACRHVSTETTTLDGLKKAIALMALKLKMILQPASVHLTCTQCAIELGLLTRTTYHGDKA
jgi:hypothetical protein